MSTPPPLGGTSRPGRILGPSLDKIIKNANWRKHSVLLSAAKSALDLLSGDLSDAADDVTPSPLLSIPASAAEAVLRPLSLALSSSNPSLIAPALDCILSLVSHRLLVRHVSQSQLIASVCNCIALADESIELLVIRTLFAAVKSPVLLIRNEELALVAKTCYNVYLGSQSGVSQLCAKLVLAQIVEILCKRVECGRMVVEVRPVRAVDMMDLLDRNLNDSNIVQAAQSFIDEVMEGGMEEVESPPEGSQSGEGGLSEIQEDALYLFKHLCKVSMKFSAQENKEDPVLMKGKILSLELLKLMIEKACSIWWTNEKFLEVVKQSLCFSLLKNSALSAMSIFQLLCSIFIGLLSRFRSGLKEEVGMFFPMLILRAVENVLQPSFLQKMTVLNMLEKICQDPQVMIDIFVNYDCDVNAPNLFERVVNGLLKTAVGVPPGSATSLSPAQDHTLRIESVKCLTCIVRSLATWLDQQLRIGDFSVKSHEGDHSIENHVALNGDNGNVVEFELQSDVSSGVSDAAALEQRRAYKLELHKGITLFNSKPSKGVDFLIKTKKIGASPEEVASFLRNASGLNPTMIGDYLGEREEFSLKVMHAYVDSQNFEGMSFGEAIRFFLRGFRLPGEAQKIDRIMEKFAERYCKCNPSSFTSAETAYVLAYSVILLNTDAHSSMIKDKMSKADFIRNNRGIDDGKDLPVDYLSSLYDQIVQSEITMIADSSAPQSRQTNSINKPLGLDSVFNLINWKKTEEKAVAANELLIKHIQEQLKANSPKTDSVFYTITDTTILKCIMEVFWGPIMAAFSVTHDQSDDKAATAQCLQGFRYAIHITSVMHMQTQRDAFVTSVAKFTNLHCAADMKQKNVDAVKAIISIAIEDGNYLQESWEHILTCLSRFEHLHLLGQGAALDSSFSGTSVTEADDKSQKSAPTLSMKKKGSAWANPAVMDVVRGGSYDSRSLDVKSSASVTPEKMNNLFSNLNLLEQIGNVELHQVFAHSQRLNGDAVVDFVKALCKVSMEELQSPRDPRVFSLTKIVEIAHYNMNRIRLVWSRIWCVLSDFFVSVGLSDNLSVAIFVMDSLRQLAMKFLDREELANYNFQNEFLRPFEVVMQRSSSSEIRELIVRCISQMVLSQVNHVKSGWKSVFMVFTTAASDECKSIVLLAFQTMEKIVRDYFPYITETETTTFTDCVKCLVTFTNSKFSSDASLNAIAFLRFCAVKLAEGLGQRNNTADQSLETKNDLDGNTLSRRDNHTVFWIPLLDGLSRLTSDPRPSVRKGAVEVLFDILMDHGHLFPQSFWNTVLETIIYPIFGGTFSVLDGQVSSALNSQYVEEDSGRSEIDKVAAHCLVDLFVKYSNVVHSQLANVVAILSNCIKSPYQQSAKTGVTALLNLTVKLGSKLSKKEWEDILLSFKEAASSTLTVFEIIVKIMEDIEVPDRNDSYSDVEQYSDHDSINYEEDEANMETTSYVVSRLKNHIVFQLKIIEAVLKLYEVHHRFFSAVHVSILVEILSSIASHANEVNCDTTLHLKLQKACFLMENCDPPPVVHFENETHQNLLLFLQTLLSTNKFLSEDMKVEFQVVTVCQKILQIYLQCADHQVKDLTKNSTPSLHWILPISSAKKEELATRTSLVVLALQVLSNLDRDSFQRNLPCIFPSLVELIRCEHSSGEVQRVLFNVFQSSIGPLILTL